MTQTVQCQSAGFVGFYLTLRPSDIYYIGTFWQTSLCRVGLSSWIPSAPQGGLQLCAGCLVSGAFRIQRCITFPCPPIVIPYPPVHHPTAPPKPQIQFPGNTYQSIIRNGRRRTTDPAPADVHHIRSAARSNRQYAREGRGLLHCRARLT